MGALPPRIGRYRVLRVLGSGGMGMVYEAEHELLRRRTAVKVLHARYAFDPEVAGRFIDDARAAAKIEHPSIVQIYQAGLDPPGLLQLRRLPTRTAQAKNQRLQKSAATAAG